MERWEKVRVVFQVVSLIIIVCFLVYVHHENKKIHEDSQDAIKQLQMMDKNNQEMIRKNQKMIRIVQKTIDYLESQNTLNHRESKTEEWQPSKPIEEMTEKQEWQSSEPAWTAEDQKRSEAEKSKFHKSEPISGE